MKKTNAGTAVGVIIAMGLAGCEATAPSPDYDALLDGMMKTSFRDQGIAKVDRLQQDASNAECSKAEGRLLPQRLANAIEKAAEIVQRLATAELSARTTAKFPLPPKLTVTAIRGGEGYSITPDRCASIAGS